MGQVGTEEEEEKKGASASRNRVAWRFFAWLLFLVLSLTPVSL
jgi:hypothetical protein